MFVHDQTIVTRHYGTALSAWRAVTAAGGVADCGVPFDYPPEPEGVRTLLGVTAHAWWTDSHGRRHWRFLAVRPDQPRHHRNDPARRPIVDPNRPPLMLVYPEGLVLRTREGITTLQAACGCGVCGRPADLGWAGPCCGPCADHRQERAAVGLPPDPQRPGLLAVGGSVRSLAWSPDGSRLAVAVEGGLSVWDASGERRGFAPAGVRGRVAFSPDGRHILESFYRGGRVWDADAGVPAVELPATAYLSAGRDWHPGTGRLVVSDDLSLLAGTPAEFAAGTPDRLPTGPADLVRFSPDGSRLLARHNGVTRLLDAGCGPVWSRDGLPGEHAAFSPDGRLVVVDAADSVDILDAATGRPAWVIREHPNNVVDLAFMPDSATLVTACSDGRVLVFDTPDRRFVGSWRGHRAGLSAMALSPDGRTLATGDDDGVVRLWPWADLLTA